MALLLKRLKGWSLLLLAGLTGCFKPLDLEKTPIPPNTVVLEFAVPVKFVLELRVDGQEIPVKYTGKNRRLWIENLPSGTHNFNIYSVSYVFGPEFEHFTVDEKTGAHFFIQARRYRSAIPKDRSQVSIRAYRKKLKRQGINVNKKNTTTIKAIFKK